MVKVHLFGQMQADFDRIQEVLGFEPVGDESSSDFLPEVGGRLCYESFHRPNPKTASNSGYLRNTNTQMHFSLLSHSAMSLFIEGLTRGTSAEILRHRFLAFSERSLRFVDAQNLKPARHPGLSDAGWARLRDEVFPVLVRQYQDEVQRNRDRGKTRKQAREAARSFLPMATETKMLVTANTRAWVDFLRQRHSYHADAEICEVARQVLGHLRSVAPNSLEGLEFPEV